MDVFTGFAIIGFIILAIQLSGIWATFKKMVISDKWFDSWKMFSFAVIIFDLIWVIYVYPNLIGAGIAIILIIIILTLIKIFKIKITSMPQKIAITETIQYLGTIGHSLTGLSVSFIAVKVFDVSYYFIPPFYLGALVVFVFLLARDHL